MLERGKTHLLSMHQLLYLETIFGRAENRLRIQREIAEAREKISQLLNIARTLLVDTGSIRDGEVKLLCEAIADLPKAQAIDFGKQFIKWVNTEGSLKFRTRSISLTNILMSLKEILPDEVISCVKASLMHESQGFVYSGMEGVNRALILLGSMIEKKPGAKEVLSEFAKNQDIRKFYLWWKHGGVERKVSDILEGIEHKGKAMGKEDVSSATISIDEQLGNLDKIVQKAMRYIEEGKFKEAEESLLEAKNLLADTNRGYMKIFTLAEGEALKAAIKHSIKTDSSLTRLSDLIDDGIKVVMRPRCLEVLKDLSRDKVHILQEGIGDSFKSTLDEAVKAIIKENPLFEDYSDELSITVEQVASTLETKEEVTLEVVAAAEPLPEPAKTPEEVAIGRENEPVVRTREPVLERPEVQYIIEAGTFLQELNARKQELDNAKENLARAEKKLKELRANKEETRPEDISEAELRITTLRHRLMMREARIGDIQTSVTNLLREHPDVGYMFPESFKAPGEVTPRQKNLFDQVKTEDMGYLLFYDQEALSGLRSDNNKKQGVAEEGLNFVQRCLRSIKERKKLLAAIEKIQTEINEKGYETVSAGLIKLSFAILFEHREWFTENNDYLQRFLSILKDLKIEDKKNFGTAFFDSEEWARKMEGAEMLEDSFAELRKSILETLKPGYSLEPQIIPKELQSEFDSINTEFRAVTEGIHDIEILLNSKQYAEAKDRYEDVWNRLENLEKRCTSLFDSPQANIFLREKLVDLSDKVEGNIDDVMSKIQWLETMLSPAPPADTYKDARRDERPRDRKSTSDLQQELAVLIQASMRDDNMLLNGPGAMDRDKVMGILRGDLFKESIQWTPKRLKDAADFRLRKKGDEGVGGYTLAENNKRLTYYIAYLIKEGDEKVNELYNRLFSDKPVRFEGAKAKESMSDQAFARGYETDLVALFRATRVNGKIPTVNQINIAVDKHMSKAKAHNADNNKVLETGHRLISGRKRYIDLMSQEFSLSGKVTRSEGDSAI